MNTAREALRHHVTGAIERGEATAIEAIEQRRPSGNQYESRKRNILAALTAVHAMLIDVGYHRAGARFARNVDDTQYARDCDRFATELAHAAARRMAAARAMIEAAPASTRRRWRAGK